MGDPRVKVKTDDSGRASQQVRAVREAMQHAFHSALGDWTPVESGPPSDDSHVLILDENEHCTFGWYGDHEGEMRWFYDDGCFANVTHYIELPLTPSGKKIRRAGLLSD